MYCEITYHYRRILSYEYSHNLLTKKNSGLLRSTDWLQQKHDLLLNDDLKSLFIQKEWKFYSPIGSKKSCHLSEKNKLKNDAIYNFCLNV